MQTLRTPDDRFTGLPDFPFQPHYVTIPDGEGGELRATTSTKAQEAAPRCCCCTANRVGVTCTAP